eukprot:scaffold1505_cov256-Pinguiococcus_pyrenoidosus.AAC.21
MQSTIANRNKHKGFLDGVDLLDSLDEYEKLTIADALEVECFEDGAVICKQVRPCYQASKARWEVNAGLLGLLARCRERKASPSTSSRRAKLVVRRRMRRVVRCAAEAWRLLGAASLLNARVAHRTGRSGAARPRKLLRRDRALDSKDTTGDGDSCGKAEGDDDESEDFQARHGTAGSDSEAQHGALQQSAGVRHLIEVLFLLSPRHICGS